jgi:hypothetical protein
MPDAYTYRSSSNPGLTRGATQGQQPGAPYPEGVLGMPPGFSVAAYLCGGAAEARARSGNTLSSHPCEAPSYSSEAGYGSSFPPKFKGLSGRILAAGNGAALPRQPLRPPSGFGSCTRPLFVRNRALLLALHKNYTHMRPPTARHACGFTSTV